MKKIIQSPGHKPIFAGSNLAMLAFAATASSFVLSAPATGQTVTYSGEMNVPYGRSYRDENTPYNPTTRDENGNRLIINGRMVNNDGSTLTGGIGGDFFSQQAGTGNAGAIGNQLNVYTVGNWNTVIIDSTQINNGNQTVNMNDASAGAGAPDGPMVSNDENSAELNGEINLDD